MGWEGEGRMAGEVKRRTGKEDGVNKDNLDRGREREGRMQEEER